MRRKITDNRKMNTGHVLILIHHQVYKNCGDKETRKEIYNSQNLTQSYIISFAGT